MKTSAREGRRGVFRTTVENLLLFYEKNIYWNIQDKCMKFQISENTINFIETAILSYSVRGLRDTANKAKYLLRNIKEKREADYKQIFQELEYSLDREIEILGPYPYKCWAQIKQIYADAIDKPLSPLLENVFPYLDEYIKTMVNLKSIEQIVDDSTLNPLEKYYLNCFAYMIIIEGSYKNWIKILYYLFYKTYKRNITLDRINKDNLPNLINNLQIWGLDDTIFECYKEGHLRNAIAHAHFSFDKNKGKMKFENWDKGVLIWDDEYTLEEFMWLRHKATLFTDLCLDVIFLLRFNDICYVNIQK